jgi:hypothetical protein
MNGWELKSDYELLNLDTKKVQTAGTLDKRTESSSVLKVEFKDVQPGNYQLTYKNISGFVSYIDLCPGK